MPEQDEGGSSASEDAAGASDASRPGSAWNVHRRPVDDIPHGSIDDRRIRDEDRHPVHAAVVAAQFQMMFTGRNIRNDEIDDRHARRR